MSHWMWVVLLSTTHFWANGPRLKAAHQSVVRGGRSERSSSSRGRSESTPAYEYDYGREGDRSGVSSEGKHSSGILKGPEGVSPEGSVSEKKGESDQKQVIVVDDDLDMVVTQPDGEEAKPEVLVQAPVQPHAQHVGMTQEAMSELMVELLGPIQAGMDKMNRRVDSLEKRSRLVREVPEKRTTSSSSSTAGAAPVAGQTASRASGSKAAEDVQTVPFGRVAGSVGMARDTRGVFGMGASVAGTSSSDSSHSSGSYGSTPMGPYHPGMSRHGPHQVHPDYIAPRDGGSQWATVFPGGSGVRQQPVYGYPTHHYVGGQNLAVYQHYRH